jgi:hypothetical protein
MDRCVSEYFVTLNELVVYDNILLILFIQAIQLCDPKSLVLHIIPYCDKFRADNRLLIDNCFWGLDKGSVFRNVSINFPSDDCDSNGVTTDI